MIANFLTKISARILSSGWQRFNKLSGKSADLSPSSRICGLAYFGRTICLMEKLPGL